MHVVQYIQQAVAARNRELAIEAVIEAALGVLFCALVFGGVYVIAWFALMFMISFDASRASQYALGLTAIYATVATFSAWRRVDPLANVRRLSDVEESLMMMGPMLPYGIGMQPRHATAGAAVVLIGGPANLLEAWATWRHRLPSSGRVIESAAEVLQQAAHEVQVQQVADPLAAQVLHRLGLIKVTGEREKRLGLTEKGRGVLAGSR